MKKLAMTMIVTAALGLTAWQIGRAHESLASFQIIVERTDTSVNLQCARGCAWTTASYSCNQRRFVWPAEPVVILKGEAITGSSKACRFQVDERGVAGHEKP
jgi:hypothetical protein